MSGENEKIGEQFCSDLYDILGYACMKLLNDEKNHFREQDFLYSELFEHFEMVADKFIALKRLMDCYDELSTELVGFAITQDVNDFDIEFTLSNDVLLQLKEKIDKQIEYNKEMYGDINDDI